MFLLCSAADTVGGGGFRNSTQFARRNPLRSAYVDVCRETVAAARDAYADFMLDRLVRLQQIVDKIADAFPAPASRGGSGLSGGGGGGGPDQFHQRPTGSSFGRRASSAQGRPPTAYLVDNEMGPLRAELDRVAEGVGHEHAFFSAS